MLLRIKMQSGRSANAVLTPHSPSLSVCFIADKNSCVCLSYCVGALDGTYNLIMGAVCAFVLKSSARYTVRVALYHHKRSLAMRSNTIKKKKKKKETKSKLQKKILILSPKMPYLKRLHLERLPLLPLLLLLLPPPPWP